MFKVIFTMSRRRGRSSSSDEGLDSFHISAFERGETGLLDDEGNPFLCSCSYILFPCLGEYIVIVNKMFL